MHQSDLTRDESRTPTTIDSEATTPHFVVDHDDDDDKKVVFKASAPGVSVPQGGRQTSRSEEARQGSTASTMTSFDKSEVDAAELSEAEVCRVAVALLGREPSRTWKLSNGGCAANYGVEFLKGAQGDEASISCSRCVIKAVTGGESASLAATQLKVLTALRGSHTAPAPLADFGVSCETTKGLTATAVAMEFVDGEPANLLVKKHKLSPARAYAGLAAALGKVHRMAASDPELTKVAATNDVSGTRFLETYIRVPPEETVDSLFQTSTHDFVANWLLIASSSTHGMTGSGQHRLAAARTALADPTLKRGLLHGDPYADNVLLDLSSSSKQECDVVPGRLIDWEDVCVGPLAYDLGAAAVACAFRYDAGADAAHLLPDVLDAIFSAYFHALGPESRTLFSPRDADALTGLMRANALAVATYRWHQFCILDPDAPAAARDSYKEMVAIAAVLESPAGDDAITQRARQALLAGRVASGS